MENETKKVHNMGRPKSKDFTPEEFQKLSKEERQLRGRMSTLKRMISKRELDIEELLKPIHKKKLEIQELKGEIGEIKSKIQNLGLEFPEFRVEDYLVKGKPYYRGVWYVNSKKTQLYLGSENKVHQRMGNNVKGFKKLRTQSERNKKILEEYLPDLQLNYWEKEYQDFKSS